MTDVKIQRGKAPAKDRWGLSTIKKGFYAEYPDITAHAALRAAASRASKGGRAFSVRKESDPNNPQAPAKIRVYRTK